METHFDIEQLIDAGKIATELDYERAMLADRKLRLPAKENNHFKKLRSSLRDLIESYEQQHWAHHKTITSTQLHEGELAERAVEVERAFIEKRKLIIRKKLKDFELNQEELGRILCHKSETHMSELMNGKNKS